MKLIDSSGWLHCLMNGPLAERYAAFLSRPKEVLTPTVVLYEVYKKAKSLRDEDTALMAAGAMAETHVVPLTAEISYAAAELSLQYRLSMADSIIYQTARSHGTALITSDIDFKNLPDVTYIPSEE